jgi:hypothetical protein
VPHVSIISMVTWCGAYKIRLMSIKLNVMADIIVKKIVAMPKALVVSMAIVQCVLLSL